MTDDVLTLHGVAIKKHGTAGDIASVTAQPVETVERELAGAVAKGRAIENGGKYTLTPAGAVILKMAYPRTYAALRGDAAFMFAYEAFERINIEVKELISAWQTLEVAGRALPNDHSDKEYDDRIIFRLGGLHEKAEGILARLTAGLPRLGRYADALSAALEKAEAGDIQWVSDARTESYHTVWFELHEDLLRVVGREREE